MYGIRFLRLEDLSRIHTFGLVQLRCGIRQRAWSCTNTNVQRRGLEDGMKLSLRLNNGIIKYYLVWCHFLHIETLMKAKQIDLK